jgi:hypothetical protein
LFAELRGLTHVLTTKGSNRPCEGLLGDLLVKQSDLAVQEVDLAQTARHCLGLLLGERLFSQPDASLAAEEVAHGWAAEQAAHHDGMHLVLDPRACPHQS